MIIEQYLTKRANIITSIQNDLETLATWEYKEFMPLDKLSQSDRLIVTLSGFNSVHDMLEDVRNYAQKKKQALLRLESKIKKLNERI